MEMSLGFIVMLILIILVVLILMTIATGIMGTSTEALKKILCFWC